MKHDDTRSDQILRLLHTAAAPAGLTGVALIVLGMVVSGLSYVDAEGESYRILNHVVSELGQVGVARMAWAFNSGLIAGGLGILLFLAGLAMWIRGRFRFALLGIGLFTGICGMMVGFFPMNHLPPHLLVAYAFFYGGLLTMTGFSAYVLFSRSCELPRSLAIPGVIAAIGLCVFLFLSGSIDRMVTGKTVLNTGLDGVFITSWQRPDVWPTALLEWVAIGALLLWVVVVAVALAAGRVSAGGIPGSEEPGVDGQVG
jgi:hypothetical membrane protein